MNHQIAAPDKSTSLSLTFLLLTPLDSFFIVALTRSLLLTAFYLVFVSYYFNLLPSSFLPSLTTTPPSQGDQAMSISRTVIKSILAVETPEGAGAVVRRSIGTAQMRNFSPFLMLDNVSYHLHYLPQ